MSAATPLSLLPLTLILASLAYCLSSAASSLWLRVRATAPPTPPWCTAAAAADVAGGGGERGCSTRRCASPSTSALPGACITGESSPRCTTAILRSSGCRTRAYARTQESTTCVSVQALRPLSLAPPPSPSCRPSPSRRLSPSDTSPCAPASSPAPTAPPAPPALCEPMAWASEAFASAGAIPIVSKET